MTVHFIGAGPGAADLITVRGLKLIQSCGVCLYAGSLVPNALITDNAPEDARVVNTANMSLDAIIDEMREATLAGLDVARVHSGDPSIYSAMNEQMRRLDRLNIGYDVTPGVPAFAAAAAACKQELTIPTVNQSIILTRTSVNSSPMPEGETLSKLAVSKSTMILHLSVKTIAKNIDELILCYGADCPAILATRIGWPDETIIRTVLKNVITAIVDAQLTRTTLLFIGEALRSNHDLESKLYSR